MKNGFRYPPSFEPASLLTAARSDSNFTRRLQDLKALIVPESVQSYFLQSVITVTQYRALST